MSPSDEGPTSASRTANANVRRCAGRCPENPPPRLDRHGRRILGLPLDVDDLATQFPRRPQRIEQLQVVIRQQGRRSPCRQPADHVHRGRRGGVDAFCRRDAPSSQSPDSRFHARSNAGPSRAMTGVTPANGDRMSKLCPRQTSRASLPPNSQLVLPPHAGTQAQRTLAARPGVGCGHARPGYSGAVSFPQRSPVVPVVACR